MIGKRKWMALINPGIGCSFPQPTRRSSSCTWLWALPPAFSSSCRYWLDVSGGKRDELGPRTSFSRWIQFRPSQTMSVTSTTTSTWRWYRRHRWPSWPIWVPFPHRTAFAIQCGAVLYDARTAIRTRAASIVMAAITITTVEPIPSPPLCRGQLSASHSPSHNSPISWFQSKRRDCFDELSFPPKCFYLFIIFFFWGGGLFNRVGIFMDYAGTQCRKLHTWSYFISNVRTGAILHLARGWVKFGFGQSPSRINVFVNNCNDLLYRPDSSDHIGVR